MDDEDFDDIYNVLRPKQKLYEQFQETLLGA